MSKRRVCLRGQSTNCEISFINSYNCYGPAVLQITGVNMNGGGCYVFKNQL